MLKAIVIGASSGIGRELAKILSANGYEVGLTARRFNLLQQLRKEIPAGTYIKQMDIAKPSDAIAILKELANEMGSVDLIIINAGVGFTNPQLDWKPEQDTIDVNVTGFVAMANYAVKYFIKKGNGHIVGISSIAALMGNDSAPAYNASKAFISNYMAGLKRKMVQLKLPIIITDIQPGFVDTAMAKADKLFWVASPEKAARQIFTAIKRKKRHAYITKRWRLIAWLIKFMPEWLYNRL